ncbi:hypothetical protein AKJ61_04800, partial [candidate division MSBL1 archaeon SCGC-AAA259B11]
FDTPPFFLFSHARSSSAVEQNMPCWGTGSAGKGFPEERIPFLLFFFLFFAPVRAGGAESREPATILAQNSPRCSTMFGLSSSPNTVAKLGAEKCPECDEKGLYKVDGTPPLWCENCGWRGYRNELAKEVLNC